MTKQNKPKTLGNLHLFSDPGHGWLRMPINHIKLLNIADKISQYSRIRGRYAFIEEDSDADRFFAALKDAGHVAGKMRHTVSNKLSKIRKYPRFSPEQYAIALSDPLNGPVYGNIEDDAPADEAVIHKVFMDVRSGFIWLISEIDKSDRNIAFGWARLAVPEFAEWGTIDLAEIKTIGARPVRGWLPMRFKHVLPQVDGWIKNRYSGTISIDRPAHKWID